MTLIVAVAGNFGTYFEANFKIGEKVYRGKFSYGALYEHLQFQGEGARLLVFAPESLVVDLKGDGSLLELLSSNKIGGVLD
ncbi:MAG: hypothetical protein QW429_02180, partial [Thermoprotei archaeon]